MVISPPIYYPIYYPITRMISYGISYINLGSPEVSVGEVTCLRFQQLDPTNPSPKKKE